MIRLHLPALDARSHTDKAQTARVYVGGRRRRDLQATYVQLQPPPRLGSARIVVQACGGDCRIPRIEQVGRLPEIGREVTVRFGGRRFEGRMKTIELSADPARGETLHGILEHRLQRLLDRTLEGRWHYDGNDAPLHWPQAKLEFNTTTDTLASPVPIELRGRRCRTFYAGGYAVAWTAADALGYLFAAAGGETRWPSREELVELLGEMELEPCRVAGRSLGEAITEIADRSGIVFRLNGSQDGLIAAGRTHARRKSIRLQPPGQSFRRTKTNLRSARIVSEPVRPRPIRVCGAPRRHEATFELYPGWYDEAATVTWRSTRRRDNADWPDRQRTFRRWLLGEHDRLAGGAARPFDAAESLGAEDFLLRRPRRFLPCLSTNTDGQSYGIHIEYRTSPSGDWRPWAGPAWVSEDECAVTLGGECLPGDYYRAARDETVELRVTASIEADRPVEAVRNTEADGPKLVRRLPDARLWLVHPTSIFHAGQSTSPTIVRDDRPRLEALAERLRREQLLGLSFEASLGWLDADCRIGDVVDRIDGRGLSLGESGFAPPRIARIDHDFLKQQTHLRIEA